MSLDAARASLSNWSVGLGYSGKGAQACGYLMNLGRVFKMMVSYKLSSRSMLGVQLTKPIVAYNGWETTVTCGYMQYLANGNLVKVKVDTHGIFSALWEGRLADRGGKVSFSGQFDLKDVNKAPKVGLSMELGQ